MAGDLFDRFVEGATAEAFSDEAVVSAMLRFEIALCRAQSSVGWMPEAVADALADRMASATFDVPTLGREGAHAGSVAIPFVKTLSAHVAAGDAGIARWVHFGATSQDVLDSAMALCAKDAWRDLDRLLCAAIAAARRLAERTMVVPVLARTLLQPAGVTTVGYRAAQWARALSRCRQRLRRAAASALAVSLAGAAGDLAVLDPDGDAIRADVARRLGLADPGGTWHALRDEWIAFHVCLGTLAGVMSKMAGDIALSAQFEIGEMSEPEAPGRGGSTAMPHKRNPVLSLRVRAATQPVPGWIANLLAGADPAFERALGGWQAELATVPRLWSRMLGATEALAALFEGVMVDEARCRANIDALGGLLFADRLLTLWAPALGKEAAQARIEALCRRARSEGRPLQVLAESASGEDERLRHLSGEALARCFDVPRAADAAIRQGRRLLESLGAGEDGTG
ncbi:MAG: lyase family protein [Burkholderiales bacterium]